MTLGEILSGVRLKQPIPPELAGADIGGLDYDSRRVGRGFLFFAFPGSPTFWRTPTMKISRRRARRKVPLAFPASLPAPRFRISAA